MKKILQTLVFVLCAMSIHAQSQPQPAKDQQGDMNALVHKIDSLEHELSYLKLTYELYTLVTDITIFANEVQMKALTVQLSLYTQNVNSKLADSFQQVYESYLNKKQATSDLIKAKKDFFNLKILTYSYTESELNTLVANYNFIDDVYDLLDNSMKMLRISVDSYKELCDY